MYRNYNKLIFDNIDRSKIDTNVLPRYYIVTDYDNDLIEVHDFSDFTIERFSYKDGNMYSLLEFIRNNPSRFINLDVSAVNHSDVLLKRCSKSIEFRDGTIIFERADSLIINYNNGEKHYLRAVKEVDKTRFLYDDKSVYSHGNLSNTSFSVQLDMVGTGFTIEFWGVNESTSIDWLAGKKVFNTLMSFRKQSNKGFLDVTHLRRYKLSDASLNGYKAESIRDTIQRGIWDESLILVYYNSITKVTHTILDDFSKLHIYFPNVVDDKMVGELAKRAFLEGID